MQKLFLKVHRWLQVGSILYINWLKMFSVTWTLAISRKAYQQEK